MTEEEYDKTVAYKRVIVSNVVINQVPLPVMPLYDLSVAAQLIPMRKKSLIEHLSRYRTEFPAVYRLGPLRRRIRLLSGPEIVKIRSQVLRGPGLSNALVLYPDPVTT